MQIYYNMVKLAKLKQEGEGQKLKNVSMFEAKTNLSKYVASVENRTEPYIIISRGGKPVARIVPYEPETNVRIGLAEGALPYLSSLDAFNSVITEDDFAGNGGIL